MVTVLLYGFLGQRFGKVHRYDVRSPAEAVRALSCTLPGFRKAFIDGGSYRVVVGGREALPLERTGDPISERESIRIVPVIAGAKSSLGQIIIGAALIWAAWPVAGGAAGGLFGASKVGLIAAKFATSIGISLVLGGVSQLLFSPPKPGSVDRPENKPSHSFDGAVNTAAQGNPIPIGYGRLIVGSQVISAGMRVEQLIKVPAFSLMGKVT